MDGAQLDLLLRKYAHERTSDYVSPNVFPRRDVTTQECWVSAISDEGNDSCPIHFECVKENTTSEVAPQPSESVANDTETGHNPEDESMNQSLGNLSEQDVSKLIVGVIQSTLHGNMEEDKVEPLAEQIFKNIEGFLKSIYKI